MGEARNVLIIAYHYPPIQGSSGYQRALSLSRYLPEFDWRVTVLTAHQRAYEALSDDNAALIPTSVEVVRAQAWDAARHFGVRGRYPGILAIPDRWQSWILGALIQIARRIRSDRPDVIYSTFPIASAHLIGLFANRLWGVPWVAEFRDPMTQEDYPKDPVVWNRLRRIERSVLERASAIVTTTQSAASYYRDYPGLAHAPSVTAVENGFDPQAFPTQSDGHAPQADSASNKPYLLHSGLLYPKDRDPTSLLRAIATLRARRPDIRRFDVVLRASGYESRYQALVDQMGLEDCVRLAPPLPYHEALQEMSGAHALLLLQGRGVNRQIPAKAYEYLWTQRPIIALTDPNGETGQLLSRLGVRGIAALEDDVATLQTLESSLDQIQSGQYYVPPRETVMALSREERARDVAAILESVLTKQISARSTGTNS